MGKNIKSNDTKETRLTKSYIENWTGNFVYL